MNQTVHGSLATGFSVDRYTFSAAAQQQVQFIVTAADAAVEFDLLAPNGTAVFSGLTASSGQISLPAAGTYTLVVHASGSGGAYAFQMQQSSIISLTLGVPYENAILGSGQSQIFQITASSANPILVTLTDENPGDFNELYIGESRKNADET